MTTRDVVTPRRRRSVWRGLAVASCALLLASVAGFYHPGTGFSSFAMLPAGHAEVQALGSIPHYLHPAAGGYDGMFYAQLALDPLLRDPSIDRVLDSPVYRARRILFSWTAYAAGLGRPWWVLQAYALQNVVCWLLLAWLSMRWLPPDNARGFALWAAVMFSHGLLTSVGSALIDGPSLLLVVAAIALSERGRPWAATAVLAISGLARETNILAGAGLPWPAGWRGWLRVGVSAIVIVIPLLVWIDYVRSVYWTTSPLSDVNQISWPLAGYAAKWRAELRALRIDGLVSPAGWTIGAIIALPAEGVAVLCWHKRWREPWWRVAAAYTGLMVILDAVVWEGYPGAVTRVLLPLTFGYNVLLARVERGFWAWYVVGNLHLVAALHTPPIAALMNLV